MTEQLNTESEQEQAAVEPTGTDPGTKTEGKTEEKTFSQTDLNRIVRERLDRERQKYADYDAMKEQAAKWAEHEEAQKSEQQKLEDKLAKAQEENARLREQHTHALIKSAIVAEAQRQGFTDPDDAYSLINLAEVTVSEDGKIEGLTKLLEDLGNVKPYLLTEKQPRVSATNAPRGQGQVEADAERRKRLFGGGQDILTQGGGVFLNLKETQKY